jgi:hypothetical protein
MEHQKFYQVYKDAGFFFPAPILTTYALSLHTKPFVILSGISGTGKTKIAQLFDISQSPVDEESSSTSPARNSTKLIIKVPKIYHRFNFPQALLSEILNDAEIQEFEQRAQEFKDKNNDGNFSDTYILTVEDEYGEFQVGLYGQRAQSPLIRVRYKKSNRDKKSPDYDATQHLKANYAIGDILELKKIGDKRFKVKSINDKEIIQNVRADELELLNRRCFIPVKSDWTDSSELFGFYNLIERKYHIPYFLEFLLNAANNPEYPFYVILDEMNLSKVEHYFSDILSCLESRIIHKGEIKQESIVLYNGLKELETNSEEFEYIPSRVEIPMNLFFTGTVNIDESAYMLSPKVIDRANIIEFNDVDLKVYAGTEPPDSHSNFLLQQDLDYTKISLASKADYEALPEDIKNHLIEVNDILKKYHIHFGYRVANEVALYVNNAIKYLGADNSIVLQALDFQFIQKIFPKLNGTYAVLEPPLKELLLYFSSTEDLSSITAEHTNFPRTTNKLLRMYRGLSTKGYASFVE